MTGARRRGIMGATCQDMDIPEGSEELTMDGARMTLATLAAFAVLAAIALPLGRWAWGVNPMKAAFESVGLPVTLLDVIPLAIVVHEALHACAWAVAGRSWAPVRFGVSPRQLMVYAHYGRPLPVSAYRFGALLPGLAMGILPFVLAVAADSAVAAGWAFLFTGLALGDFAVLWIIRRVPRGSRVIDHPSLPGCLVLPRTPS